MKFDQIFGTVFVLLMAMSVTAAPVAESISSCTRFLRGNSLERNIVASLEHKLGKRFAKPSKDVHVMPDLSTNLVQTKKVPHVIPQPSPILVHAASPIVVHASSPIVLHGSTSTLIHASSANLVPVVPSVKVVSVAPSANPVPASTSANLLHSTNEVASVIKIPAGAIEFLMALLPLNRTANATAALPGFFSGYPTRLNRTVFSSNLSHGMSYVFPTSKHMINTSSLFRTSGNSSIGAFGLFPFTSKFPKGLGAVFNSTVHRNPFLAVDATTNAFAGIVSAFPRFSFSSLKSPSFKVVPMAGLNATFAPVFNFNGLHALNANETLSSFRYLPVFSSAQLDSKHLKRHWMSLSRYLSLNGTSSKVYKRL